MTAPAKPVGTPPTYGGKGERAAFYTLAAFRVVSAKDATKWPGHSICGYSCGCKQRPAGWPKVPPTHPRFEECHI
jgi:hypothetical protein